MALQSTLKPRSSQKGAKDYLFDERWQNEDLDGQGNDSDGTLEGEKDSNPTTALDPLADASVEEVAIALSQQLSTDGDNNEETSNTAPSSRRAITDPSFLEALEAARKRVAPRQSSSPYRAKPGELGDPKWLDELRCFHCKIDLKTQEERFEHYVDVHEYDLRKYLLKRWWWVLPEWGLLNAEYEPFAYMIRQGTAARKAREAHTAAVLEDWHVNGLPRGVDDWKAELEEEKLRWKQDWPIKEWRSMSTEDKEMWTDKWKKSLKPDEKKDLEKSHKIMTPKSALASAKVEEISSPDELESPKAGPSRLHKRNVDKKMTTTGRVASSNFERQPHPSPTPSEAEDIRKHCEGPSSDSNYEEKSTSKRKKRSKKAATSQPKRIRSDQEE